MSSDLYTISVLPVLRALKNIAAILAKGEAHAKTNGIDPEEYLSGRLHPTMANLPYQVYRFTDHAKAIPVRINPTAPTLSLPDVETTFPDLLARINRVIEHLESIDPVLLNGREKEVVTLNPPGPNGTIMEIKFPALDYVMYYAHSNFWFHITVAYGILRNKGVDLGKRDFLNAAGLVDMRILSEDEAARTKISP